MESKSFNFSPITVDDVRNHSNREYNPAEWNKAIDRFLKFQDVKFFIYTAEASGDDYDRIFAIYRIKEGFRILNELDYCTAISNAGFAKITVNDSGTVTKTLFESGNGKKGYAENTPQNRKLFAKHNLIVTSVL